MILHLSKTTCGSTDLIAIIPTNTSNYSISPLIWSSRIYRCDYYNLDTKAYSINSDNNEDETINKGETIKLNVRLKNTGTSTVKGLKTTFTTTSEYVTGFASTANLNYGDISSGSWSWYGNSQTYYNVIQFTVKTNTPDNTIIPINVSMVDESGNKWTSLFYLKVTAP